MLMQHKLKPQNSQSEVESLKPSIPDKKELVVNYEKGSIDLNETLDFNKC